MSKIIVMRALLRSVTRARRQPARALLVACAATLVVPLLLPLAAANATAPVAPADGVQILPLRPLDVSTWAAGESDPGSGAQGLPATQTEPFSLLGVVWTDPNAELNGQAEVRTRDLATGEWSEWQPLAPQQDHAPDPGSAESADAGLRGGTAPLWVGESDAVEVRVVPEDGGEPSAGLPAGLRLQLIDPGEVPADAAEVTEVEPDDATATGSGSEPGTEGSESDTEPDTDPGDDPGIGTGEEPAASDHVGPRPPIVTRAGWGADESLREEEFLYTDDLRTAFVHHTAGSNDYACKEADAVIRAIYSYHLSLGWRDVGYNFFVDRCGTIYEGRAGGVTEPVMGAHTYGHNHNSMGVAVLGSYDTTQPAKRAVEGVSQLIAWKLGLFGVNPTGAADRISGGQDIRLDNVSGHRDGYATDCPGDQLYDELPTIRKLAADLQGR